MMIICSVDGRGVFGGRLEACYAKAAPRWVARLTRSRRPENAQNSRHGNYPVKESVQRCQRGVKSMALGRDPF